MSGDEDILNSREAADFLRVSQETVIREAKARRLPGRRVGKEWRFSRAVLMTWLSRGPEEDDTERYRRNGADQDGTTLDIEQEPDQAT